MPAPYAMTMTRPVLATDFTFPNDWQVTILERSPLIQPARRYVYPREVEEIERGALQLLVRPPEAAAKQAEFLGVFALGFADSAAPTGVWSCPHPGWLCAVAGGYAYLVNAADPGQWEQVEFRPVLAVTPLLQQNLLLFSGHQSLIAYGPAGKAWQTGRLSWEGFRILGVDGETLTGMGWDMMTDQEFKVEVNLTTGEHLRLD